MSDSNVTIVTDNKEIIASEHFFTINLEPFTMRLIYQNDYLDILFIFENDPSKSDSTVFASSPKGVQHIIALTYVNFDSTVGTYNREPYEIGKIAGKSLLLRSKIARPYQNAQFREISLTFFTEYMVPHNE